MLINIVNNSYEGEYKIKPKYIYLFDLSSNLKEKRISNSKLLINFSPL